MKAWHFLKADMTAGSGNEPAWTEGEERSFSKRKRIVICKSGYHSSPTAFDALQYAQGPMLCLVEISEPEDQQPDKYVSRSRKLLRVIDISRQLREFACDVAEEALNLAVQKGATKDERSYAAIEVARRFARGEASGQELAAARAAARAAAWGAAGDAAWDAARGAAWDAAGDAAWDAARIAARDAAEDAAWDAARIAARDAAWDAAWDAALAAARERFNVMVEALFTELSS